MIRFIVMLVVVVLLGISSICYPEMIFESADYEILGYTDVDKPIQEFVERVKKEFEDHNYTVWYLDPPWLHDFVLFVEKDNPNGYGLDAELTFIKSDRGIDFAIEIFGYEDQKPFKVDKFLKFIKRVLELTSHSQR